jgi:hypothetical protein
VVEVVFATVDHSDIRGSKPHYQTIFEAVHAGRQFDDTEIRRHGLGSGDFFPAREYDGR